MRHLLVVLSIAGMLASAGCGGGGGGNSPGPTTGCTSTSLPLAQQLRNPVTKFTTDNNGVILSLPQVGTGGTTSVQQGALIFGIGTQSNNGQTIGSVSATFLPIDTNPNHAAYTGISTQYNGGTTYPTSTSAALSTVLDSGTSVMLFLDTPTTGIANCNSPFGNLYCTTTSRTGINIGANGVGNTGSFTFNITNYANYNGSGIAFSDMAAPVTSGNPNSSTQAADGFFDWGLPFFYGRNVYTGIKDTTPPAGVTAPFFGHNTTATSSLTIPVAAPNGAALANVAPLIVDGFTASGFIQANVVYTTVTICAPGTTNCQTIDHIAVDTGSIGLRVLSSVLNSSLLAALPNVNPSNPVAACVQFLDQSFFWGSLRLADVKMGGPNNGSSGSTYEVASSLPIHIMGDPAFPTIPSSCSTVQKVGGGTTTGTEEDTLSTLGANGLIGLGPLQYECDVYSGGNACTSAAPTGVYYSCN